MAIFRRRRGHPYTLLSFLYSYFFDDAKTKAYFVNDSKNTRYIYRDE